MRTRLLLKASWALIASLEGKKQRLQILDRASRTNLKVAARPLY